MMGFFIWFCGFLFLIASFMSDDPIRKAQFEITTWVCYVGAVIVWRLPKEKQ